MHSFWYKPKQQPWGHISKTNSLLNSHTNSYIVKSRIWDKHASSLSKFNSVEHKKMRPFILHPSKVNYIFYTNLQSSKSMSRPFMGACKDSVRNTQELPEIPETVCTWHCMVICFYLWAVNENNEIRKDNPELVSCLLGHHSLLCAASDDEWVRSHQLCRFSNNFSIPRRGCTEVWYSSRGCVLLPLRCSVVVLVAWEW